MKRVGKRGEGKLFLFDCIKELNCCLIEEEEAISFSPNLDMSLNMNTRDELTNYLEELTPSSC